LEKIIVSITLIRPEKHLENGFRSTISEFRTMGEESVAATFSCCGDDFYKYLKYLSNAEKGLNLPKGFVPFTTFWLVRESNHILGFCHLRHYLNTSLSTEGGHIGYAIRPSERRKGYGTQQLHLLLAECRKLNYEQVLITCDFDNIASQKIIEKNGGIRSGEAISPRSLKKVFHYLVRL
jgi:predicted acetyltransferase